MADMDENPYKPPSLTVEPQRKSPRWLINAAWTALGALGGLAIVVVVLLVLIAIIVMRRFN